MDDRVTVPSYRHDLRSGTTIEVLHGSESLLLQMRQADGRYSVAHLTPAEAMALGASLHLRGFMVGLDLVGDDQKENE